MSYFNPTDSYLYNKTVIVLGDDSPTPRIGKVLGWLDEDTCMVLWEGDERPIPEFMDEVTPRR